MVRCGGEKRDCAAEVIPRSRPSTARPRRWRSALQICALALVLAPGCKKGPELSLNFGQTARENYELAITEFKTRDWEDAIKYADYVRSHFPFSRFAVEAELLIARSHFEAREYLSSRDSFKQFGRLHPTHRHVRNGWVAYMVAVSAYMAAPHSRSILLPRPFELDQSILEDALIEIDAFFDHHGNSKLAPLATKLQLKVQRELLDHELYVARFYLDRNNPEAAIGRLESASRRFPGVASDAGVMFLLGVTYLRVQEIELSRATFSELQSLHPTHHHGRQARVYLRWIYDKYGAADPNRARPDRSRPIPVTPPRPKREELPQTKAKARKQARQDAIIRRKNGVPAESKTPPPPPPTQP